MRISEEKKKIVIDNYFKAECDVNTSIKGAFIKGFELGLKKAPVPQLKVEQWIPCSERLPPLGEEVLVWAYDRCYLLTLYAYPNNEGYYWSVEDYDVTDDAFDKIIAWMPLPEPYTETKGEQHD